MKWIKLMLWKDFIHRQMEGWKDKMKPVIPPLTLLVRGIIMNFFYGSWEVIQYIEVVALIYFLQLGCAVIQTRPFTHGHDVPGSPWVNWYRINIRVTPSTWWYYDMEKLSVLLALCEGIHQLLWDSPHRGSVMWSFGVIGVISCAASFLTNIQVANDLRQLNAHVTPL